MVKVFGFLLFVVAVWVGIEVSTQGVDGAFGGAFSFLSDEPVPAAEHRWAGERAESAVNRAHDLGEARREKLLGAE